MPQNLATFHALALIPSDISAAVTEAGDRAVPVVGNLLAIAAGNVRAYLKPSGQ
jgi:hypothetical protein